jgi:hypothetical protein
MRKTTEILRVSLMAFFGAAVLFVACTKEKEKDPQNMTTVDGVSVELTKGYLENYGEVEEGLYNFDLLLLSSGLDYVNETGTGNAIYFEMFVNSATFNGGTFTYSVNPAVNTFDDAGMFININIATGSAERYFMVTGGTVTVNKTGNQYSINYTLTAQEYNWMTELPIGTPKSITGSYNGSLTLLDATEEKSAGQKSLKFVKE